MSNVLWKHVGDQKIFLGYKPRISFICCVNDDEVFNSTLLASLDNTNPHVELIKVTKAASVAEAFNKNIQNVSGDIVVLVHQDVWIPQYWTIRMETIYDMVSNSCNIGVLGVAGCVTSAGLQYNNVVHREYLLYNEPMVFPKQVDSLDELILIFPSVTNIRLHGELGWHMYGADACLQATRGGRTNLVVSNPVWHDTKRTALDEAFYASVEAFKKIYPNQPIKTTCINII